LASTTKVLSCDYALEKLGPTFQFETNLSYKGTINNGVLKGDLYFTGNGDPSFLTNNLMDMSVALRKLKIEKVDGTIFFPKELKQIISKQGTLDEPYNPSVGLLNTNFNRWTFYQEEVIPPFDHIQMQESNEGFYYDQRFRFEEAQGVEKWLYSAKIHYRGQTDAAIRKPHLYTTKAFQYILNLWGIESKKVKEMKSFDELPLWSSEIFQHKSLPLMELCSQALEYSNNLFTEAILMKAANSYNIKTAVNKLSAHLKKMYKWKNFQLDSGSGLTYTNKAQANDMTYFLQQRALHQYDGKRGLLSLLSGNGVNGFMANRMIDKDMYLRSWSKTGSLDYVNNIIGVLFPQSKKPIVYFIGLTHESSRQLIEKPLSQRTDTPGMSPGSFRRLADEAIDQIITYLSTKH
tara:strand:+ start:51725 stop:52939 length:1215 start_codon:yes stop_codon:yes gene_type:complete